jgi:tape measure domain-containing protein
MARSIVGEIFLNVLPIDGGVTPGVQRIIDNAQTKAVDIPVSADTEQASNAVTALSGQIEGQIGGAWQAAAAEAAVFTAAVFGIKAAIEGAVNQLAGLFDQLAQAQAGFTAILGSESAGGQLLDDIREFARVSPFVTQELVNYSQQLLGVGQSAESIIPLLRSTGDLIASVGGDTQNISRVLFTLTQIRSIGRLVGQDAIQLQSALVPITKLLADFLGKTTAEVKKLQEQGAISADTVFAAITNAGSKVEGAMNNATRNISGARSVFQDTVKIMFQDSQTLNKVFEDVVAGILKFTNALGENERLQEDIAQIDDALLSLYESLQPLLDGLSDTSALVALNALDVLGASLQVLAGVLNSIPPGVLENVGRALAVLAALKAPFFLIRYVQSIQEMTRGLKTDLAARLTATAAGIEQTGAAARNAELHLGKYNLNLLKTVNIASAVAIGLGLITSSMAEQNEVVKTLGNTLTTTAIGAQIGTAFAPGIGTAIGAGVGAGVGLITSFITGAKEEAARQKGEIEAIATKAREDFDKAFALTTPTIDTTLDFKKYLGDISDLQATVDVYDELIAQRNALQEQAQEFNLNTATAAPGEAEQGRILIQRIQLLQDEIDKTGDEADIAREKINQLLNESTFAEATQNLSTKLTALKKDSETYKSIVNSLVFAEFPATNPFDMIGTAAERAGLRALLFGDRVAQTEEDFDLLNRMLSETGLGIDQLFILPIEDAIAIIEDKMPSALTQLRIELNTTVTKFDEAKKAAAEFFGTFTKDIQAAQAASSQSAAVDKAIDAFTNERSAANALELSEALLKVAETIAAANNAVFEGTGNDAGIAFLITQLEALRDGLKLTDTDFNNLLITMGLFDEFQTRVAPGFVGNLTELSEVLGLSSDRLKEVIPGLRELEGNEEIVIPINILEKLEQLALFTDDLRALPGVTDQVVADIQAAIAQIDFTGGIAQVQEMEAALKNLRGVSSAPNPNAGGAMGLFGDIDIEELERRALEFEKFQRDTKYADEVAAEKRAADLAEKNRKEQERLAEEARREAERLAREQEAAQREAERIAEELRREQEALRKALKDSAQTIQDSMLRASEEIASAAQEWTASIKERVQQEPGVSVSRLIRNAQDQASQLGELGRGISALQGRGLSQGTLDALGIDNVTDLRQVRKLLAASTGDLAQLNSLVALRDSNAEAIARRERQQETQATIVAAIIQAATILGYEITPEAARALSMTFNITGNPESAVLPAGIIEQIQNAGVLLRT